MGDTSINEFKQFIIEQLREDNKIDQDADLHTRKRTEPERAIKLERVAFRNDDEVDLGQAHAPKSHADAEMIPAAEVDHTNVKDTSQMLVYALHYEVKLMRKAFQVIQANSLINQT